MNVFEEVNNLAGRQIEFQEVTRAGQKGYMPLYINFNLQSRLSEVFAPTMEESASKFLEYLKGEKNAGVEPTS